jgi:hypothetical protein
MFCREALEEAVTTQFNSQVCYDCWCVALSMSLSAVTTHALLDTFVTGRLSMISS